MLQKKGIDTAILFGNLGDVIATSEAFLDTLQLEVKSKSDPNDQMVGTLAGLITSHFNW